MQLRVVSVLLFVSWTITAVVGGNLYATWSSLYGTPLTMSYLDPQTAKQGKQILTVDGAVELFAITPGIDQANQRVFIPFITGGSEEIEGEEGPSPFQSSLYTFDISNPNAVKILFKTQLPQAYVLGVLYDPVDDGAFVIAMNLNSNTDEAAPDTNVYMGFVSAKDGSFRNVTVFPPTLVPFGGALGGTPVALDPKNRIIVMGTIANRKQDPLVTVYNINTKTFTTKPNPAFFIGAMSFNSQTGKFLCLLEPHNSPQGNLSYAILNPTTATYNIITTWSATTGLFFIIGSMSTLDAANNKLYSVIGNGEGPPVALVTINAVTGKRDNVVYFGASQPQSIFFL